ncbi:type II toxin-antitoxin system RelE/ParE family toxin [Paludibacterium purpuratum]|uniref:Plasmid stabilization system protein ParE n=1 Tax=Paludibacterium purpuratum TaxID=1144873 RepID=A0A4R7BDQ3_9NEIS|nr:type II toxin-antitoxin system RelE/ParE family toxin [Paludibacterium purpuratum]TDR82115.1 plasmid stabilization system protein ParE [Paludibacterium purpuratum]
MTAQTVFLRSAEIDLKALKRYILQNFGQEAWLATYGQIKSSVAIIQSYPEQGWIPDELQSLNLTQYRQVISGMNRIVYEIRGDMAYIHIICDSRKDLKALLIRRLLQA